MTGIHIRTIDIKVLEKSSGIFNSQLNTQNGWKSLKKENQGWGEINGKEITLKQLLDAVDDQDTVDHYFT
ncbi:hypothetical protein PU629_04505 [Pullulanibacillus sp. KACC 23026]|uniref:hypothetical protein n=1 Tax=Pullulanibacillus sp. KACC 23026 TaxID=3028315 RepID=UPI0023B06874|nr:hypothetical protein [Pullulanibacillus sp. KACC 23026]WEG13634.1 hypothetical protein PU629_04505 [Pullulanibacillus sp. KACC 23026]